MKNLALNESSEMYLLLLEKAEKLGWTNYYKLTGSKKLPNRLLELAEERNCFKSGRFKHIGDLIFYKGEAETSTEWIMVSTDGRYFESHGNYAIWHSRKHNTDSGYLYLGVTGRNLNDVYKYIYNEILY